MTTCLEREINAFLWLALIGVTVFLLGKLAKIFQLWIKARPLPGPPSPSIYGHGHLISTSNLTDTLYKIHKEYGGVVKLWLCPTQLLVSIKDVELIREVLLKAEDKLPSIGKAFRLAFGKSSLFVSSFDKVENLRKSLEVKLGGKLVENTLIPDQIVDSIIEKAQVGGAVDCDAISLRLAFTMLGSIIFGDDFLAWPKAVVYEELLMKVAKDACFWASYGVAPFWKRGYWRYKDSCTKLKSLTCDLIKDCRKNCNSGFVWDFGGNDDTGYEPTGDMISLMVHGSLTMAALIATILTKLVVHLDIQDKIHSEVVMAERVGGRSYQEKFNLMPNLLATVYESARLLPAAPLLQRCSLQHDLILKNGMVIPAGAMVVVPILLVQRDSLNWGNDVLEFNPQRFLSETANRYISNHKEHLTEPTSPVVKEPSQFEAFFSFGSGARCCIGQKLTIRGISSLFAALVANYEVRLWSGSESGTKPTMSKCVLQMLPSPEIVFVRRGNKSNEGVVC